MSITYEYSSLITTGSFVLLTVMTLFYCFTSRKASLFPYSIIILFFAGTMYGTTGTTLTMYTRGTGVFVIPLINIFLLTLFLYQFCVSRFDGDRIREVNIVNIPIVLLCLVIVCYYIYGVSRNDDYRNIFSSYGLINIINLFLFIKVLSWTIITQDQLNRFFKIFLYITIAMALYGLIRYAIFGGDPANYYRTFEDKSVRISFFDFGQSVLFCIVFSYLYQQYKLLQKSPRVFHYMLMAACLANIILSFRRNAWLGIGFALSWLFIVSDVRRKVVVILTTFVVIGAVLSVYQLRFETGRPHQKGGAITNDIVTNKGELDIKRGRFAELYNAVKAANKSPLIGLGPWGINNPRVDKAKNYDFVHSSLVHMYVKLGLAGLLIFLALLAIYVCWWLRHRQMEWNCMSNKIIAESFFCGFICSVPDLLFGTPLIIFRHSQILAMLIGMPGICYFVDKKFKN